MDAVWGAISEGGPWAVLCFYLIVQGRRDKKNGNGATVGNPSMGISKEQMAEMQQGVHDLHEWQIPQLTLDLKGIKGAIEENTLAITESHKGLRKSIDEQTGAVVKNTATLEIMERKFNA